MTAKIKYCEYDCGREATCVPHNGEHTTCQACYMRMRYAIERGTTWMIRRSRQIGSWNTTLAVQLGDVASAKQKRRRA